MKATRYTNIFTHIIIKLSQGDSQSQPTSSIFKQQIEQEPFV